MYIWDALCDEKCFFFQLIDIDYTRLSVSKGKRKIRNKYVKWNIQILQLNLSFEIIYKNKKINLI